ncbi:MAG: D-glycero-beta-D-manno-heptose 1-phosphate adenylyltransferase [Lewinella sp.]|nr:D-glycero-beta-D-manno-heptose 1-phosphate adenylyltransferase [Lewinella sp.]
MIDLIRHKIQDRAQAARTLAGWRLAGGKIVFTNGCFDLLHPGHMQYLAEARGLGRHLVIGLNSDDSVRRLKGDSRPIMAEADRALMLAALSFVDLVVIFEEDTPLALIQALQPDVLVKGGDYAPDQIVGADVVKDLGGTVTVIPFVPGYSTTAIEQRIKNQ